MFLLTTSCSRMVDSKMSTDKPVQLEEGGCMIRPLRIFLNKLAKDIADTDLEQLCFLLDCENSTRVELLRILMKKKGLTENNLEQLAEHLSSIDRKDLAQRVIKFSETSLYQCLV